MPLTAGDGDEFFAGEETKWLTGNTASIIEDTKTEEDDDEEEKYDEVKKLKPDLIDSNAESTQINSSLLNSEDDPLQMNQQQALDT